jgi:uncharacterized protein with HEPN domain
MKKDSLAYLEDILECIDIMQRYTKNVRWHDFERDIQMQDAVIRRFEIIGEAIKRIPSEVRKEDLEIPWKRIGGMRDLLIHEYDEITLSVIWKTIQEDIEPFKIGIKNLRKKLKNN